MAALRACEALMPQGMKLRITSIAELPLFNQDVFDAAIPEPCKRLRAEIAQADGVLIASPGVQLLGHRAAQECDRLGLAPAEPVLAGQAGGALLGDARPARRARVQYDLRRILGQLWAHVLPRPEVFIGSSATKFADGKLTDETTRKFLVDLLAGFKPWIERMRVAK